MSNGPILSPLNLHIGELELKKPQIPQKSNISKTYGQLLEEKGFRLGRTLGSGSYAKVK
jgi:hypothetical protein